MQQTNTNEKEQQDKYSALTVAIHITQHKWDKLETFKKPPLVNFRELY